MGSNLESWLGQQKRTGNSLVNWAMRSGSVRLVGDRTGIAAANLNQTESVGQCQTFCRASPIKGYQFRTQYRTGDKQQIGLAGRESNWPTSARPLMGEGRQHGIRDGSIGVFGGSKCGIARGAGSDRGWQPFSSKTQQAQGYGAVSQFLQQQSYPFQDCAVSREHC